MTDALEEISTTIAAGLNGVEGGMRSRIEALFGNRFQKRHAAPTAVRDAYALATSSDDGGIPFAGLINADNPPSGPYGGTSVVWFPTAEGSLISVRQSFLSDEMIKRISYQVEQRSRTVKPTYSTVGEAKPANA